MEKKRAESDSAKLGAQKRLERLLAAAEPPDGHLVTVVIPAPQRELGQAAGLIREVLAQAGAEKVAALHEVANAIEHNWGRVGTRSEILKLIRDRAAALQAADPPGTRTSTAVASAIRDAIRELREEQSIHFETESDEKFAVGYLYKTIILALRGTP